MRQKLRAMGAVYWSGIDPILDITTNAGSEDNINFTVTNGEVFQLHRQAFPDYDISADGIYISNSTSSGTLTNYQKITDLNSIHEVADGTALSTGDSINLCIWGSINYSSGDCKLFVNLPEGKYTVDADAISDADGTLQDKIPVAFRTTGFLIARLVLKYTTADNVTWENLLGDPVTTWQSDAANSTSPNYPSNYGNNADVTNTLTKTGAVAVRVHFSNFITEANYDYVRLYNAADVLYYTYHGSLGAFTSPEIPGTTVKVRFTSDGSVTRSGFKIDALEYKKTSIVGAEVDDLRGQTNGILF